MILQKHREKSTVLISNGGVNLGFASGNAAGLIARVGLRSVRVRHVAHAWPRGSESTLGLAMPLMIVQV